MMGRTTGSTTKARHLHKRIAHDEFVTIVFILFYFIFLHCIAMSEPENKRSRRSSATQNRLHGLPPDILAIIGSYLRTDEAPFENRLDGLPPGVRAKVGSYLDSKIDLPKMHAAKFDTNLMTGTVRAAAMEGKRGRAPTVLRIGTEADRMAANFDASHVYKVITDFDDFRAPVDVTQVQQIVVNLKGSDRGTYDRAMALLARFPRLIKARVKLLADYDESPPLVQVEMSLPPTLRQFHFDGPGNMKVTLRNSDNLKSLRVNASDLTMDEGTWRSLVSWNP